MPDELKGRRAGLLLRAASPATTPSDALRAELQEQVVDALGKPLRPRESLFVSDLPKTRNAKVMRRVIRAAYLGEPGRHVGLVNPEAIEEIRREETTDYTDFAD